MARFIHSEPSRTLQEYRLLPGFTSRESTIDKIDLTSKLAAGLHGKTDIAITPPVVAAAMQAVSGTKMAIAMAKLGSTAFIFCSQGIEEQAAMIREVKSTEIEEHERQHALLDQNGKLFCAAAINTHDYEKRIPALHKAGVDLLSVDSSDGFSIFQKEALEWIRKEYPTIPIIGGNIITATSFDFLVDLGVSAVKVGMGGGSICITQEQKGTGRGLATAIIDTVAARDHYFIRTGIYIPIIADGGVVTAKDVVIALALGADCVMMGRFFARFKESPTEILLINGKRMKPYWGEGSYKAREWKAARYHQAKFAEGVEGMVEYAGKLAENLSQLTIKVTSAMSSCGCASIEDLHKYAELELVSALSIREGQVHDILMPQLAGEDT